MTFWSQFKAAVQHRSDAPEAPSPVAARALAAETMRHRHEARRRIPRWTQQLALLDGAISALNTIRRERNADEIRLVINTLLEVRLSLVRTWAVDDVSVCEKS